MNDKEWKEKKAWLKEYRSKTPEERRELVREAGREMYAVARGENPRPTLKKPFDKRKNKRIKEDERKIKRNHNIKSL